MKTASEWFVEYGTHHRNPWNRLIHIFAVPTIMVSLIGLLWQIKIPLPYIGWSEWVNLGGVLLIGALVFYATMRSLPVLLVMSAAGGLSLALVLWVDSEVLPGGSLLLWIGIFCAAWVLQFIGHSKLLEGAKPSFIDDDRNPSSGASRTYNISSLPKR